MTGWVDRDFQEFLRTFSAYWPGKIKLGDPRDPTLMIWRDMVQKFDVAIVMESIKELYETQERPVAPTPAAFKSIAVPMQRFVNEKRTAANQSRELGEVVMTPEECAADESIWEPVFDRAVSEKHLQFLKGLRRHLAGGGQIAKALFPC